MLGAFRARSWDVLTLLLVFVAAALVTTRGASGPASIPFELGPNDHAFLTGFEEHYEVADGVATRWATYDATIDLPLVVDGGPVDISYRFARVYAETAEIEVFVDGRAVDHFQARGGAELTRRLSLTAVSDMPLVIRFTADSHEQQNRGLKLDWVRFDVGERGRIGLSSQARWLPSLFAAFLFALFRWASMSRAGSFSVAMAFIAALAAAQSITPFALVHWARQLILPCAVLSLGAGLALRRFPKRQWVLLVFVVGYLLRGGALFLPEIFYPDVANARDYVEAFRETEGTIAERGVETQERTNVGYPRNVAGTAYAFPYSPLYFAPLGSFASPGAIEDGVRHLGLAGASLAVIPVFWLGLTFFGPLEGVVAALLWTVMPAIFSRLLLALHATVVGSFLDLLVIVSLTLVVLKPGRTGGFLTVALTTVSSFLVYTSSLFSVTAFTLWLALLDRRLSMRILGILLASGTVTVLWLYWPFLIALVTEILPALLSGEGESTGVARETALFPALSRIPLFYGVIYPALSIAGFWLARRRLDQERLNVILSWVLAFALLLSLRAFGFGIFKDLKEIVFVAPLVALLSAVSLVTLARRSLAGRLVASALVLWLVLFGLGRLRFYLNDTPSVAIAGPSPAEGESLP